MDGWNGSRKEKAQELYGIQDGRIERGEFLKQAAILIGAVLVAGSFGAIAGCGDNTATVEKQAASAETLEQSTTQDQSSANTQTNPSDGAQGSTPAQTSTVNCRFYNDGICEKTGEPCTHCIER